MTEYCCFFPDVCDHSHVKGKAATPPAGSCLLCEAAALEQHTSAHTERKKPSVTPQRFLFMSTWQLQVAGARSRAIALQNVKTMPKRLELLQGDGHAAGDQVHVSLARGSQLTAALGVLVQQAHGLQVLQDVPDHATCNAR